MRTLTLIVSLLFIVSLNLSGSRPFKYARPLQEGINPTCHPEVKMKKFHAKMYDKVINFIKLHEGFRATPYDDVGYLAIGYGQRIKFFSDYKIGNKITRVQAHKILIKSFQNHIKYVDHYLPGLTELQKYAVAHISYGIGLGNALKWKFFYKKNGQWHINKHKLFNTRRVDREHPAYRANRQFEYKLFYT